MSDEAESVRPYPACALAGNSCVARRSTDPPVALLAVTAGVRYSRAIMAETRSTDHATMLAELRAQVRGLDERVSELGRHL
jgi:CO/xanthine dehydrogenase FAD-binding subunit